MNTIQKNDQLPERGTCEHRDPTFLLPENQYNRLTNLETELLPEPTVEQINGFEKEPWRPACFPREATQRLNPYDRIAESVENDNYSRLREDSYLTKRHLNIIESENQLLKSMFSEMKLQMKELKSKLDDALTCFESSKRDHQLEVAELKTQIVGLQLNTRQMETSQCGYQLEVEELKTKIGELRHNIGEMGTAQSTAGVQKTPPIQQSNQNNVLKTQSSQNGGQNSVLKTQNSQNKKPNVEQVLNQINTHCISLPPHETKQVNDYFTKFIKSFVAKMRKNDKLFDKIYVDILHAGSFYDGLKICKPDEYDLDLIMKVPLDYNEFVIKTHPQYPGFVSLRNENCKTLTQHPEWTAIYRVMEDWFENGFLLPGKMRCWLQSVVQLTFNKEKTLSFDDGVTVSMRMSGPAVTLLVKGKHNFDIDLVPVLRMNNQPGGKFQWPPSPVRKIPSSCEDKAGKNCWYCVPKPMKNKGGVEAERCWRLAFHDQEKILLKGKDRLKPALRLLKKFRDTQKFYKIASYYLKTICMWEVEKRENEKLWIGGTLTEVFVHLLRALQVALENKCIPYYWQKENNLLKVMEPPTIENHCQQLKRILATIDKDIYTLPTFILSKAEYEGYLERRSSL